MTPTTAKPRQLPFEPLPFLRGLTHRGLPGEDWHEASAHLIFALAMMVCRSVGQKWMEIKGWKPAASAATQQASIWAMAEKQANAMVK